MPRATQSALSWLIVVVERTYQVMTFEDRPLSSEENAQWSIALQLSAEGRRALRGRSLDDYLDEMKAVRERTLEGLMTTPGWNGPSARRLGSTCTGHGFMSLKMKSIIAGRFAGCEGACLAR